MVPSHSRRLYSGCKATAIRFPAMKNRLENFAHCHGFSLAEVLLALTIGSMVLIGVLGIYSRTQSSAAAITARLEADRKPYEVLQRITEDLDRVIASGTQTQITVQNKFDKGFATARLAIVKSIYGNKNQKETFEEIIWQSAYDGNANSLALYRSYGAIAPEDKLLDAQKEDWERELFVPVCAGITFFKIQVRKGTTLLDKWTQDALPDGVVVTISFAQPFKTIAGSLDVPDSEKTTRTIAIDRTRKLQFIIPLDE